jgi:DNA-directed RNA polymerase specialized sigma24 family protein
VTSLQLNQSLRHGYTMADLHDLARHAVHLAGIKATPWYERYQLAYSAIAEHLYATDDPPTGFDLLHTGRQAIYAEARAEQQRYGYYRAKTDGAMHGMGSSPAFRMYWWDLIAGRAPSPENRVVERLSLRQILPHLTPTQREALIALAVHDDYTAAATALGLTDTAFKSLISRGRARFRALWHEGETPSGCWGQDRRAGSTAGERRTGGGRIAMEAIRRRAG